MLLLQWKSRDLPAARMLWLNYVNRSSTILLVTTKTIQTAVTQRPFRPFTLRLANGQRIRVNDPDRAAVHPEGKSLFLFERGGGYRIVDIFLIAELQAS